MYNPVMADTTDRQPRAKTFPLRIPDDVRNALEAQAQANDRSLNNQIVHCLRECLGMKSSAAPRLSGGGMMTSETKSPYTATTSDDSDPSK